MVLSLIAAGLFGTSAAVATYWVVQLTRDENREKDRAFGEYQTDTGLQIAEANERAAGANLKAETERVERLKLEAKYAPREVTEEQVRALEKSLAPLKGQSVDVISYESLGTDVAEYAFVLTANLNRAGLHSVQFTPFSGSGLVWGILVQTEEGSPPEQTAALAAAFGAAGIYVRVIEPYPIGQAIAGGFMGPTGAVPSAKLRLLVGSKPRPNPSPGTQ